MNDRRTSSRDPVNPSVREIKGVFHRLWGKQVGNAGYSKRDWRELQSMLRRKAGLDL